MRLVHVARHSYKQLVIPLGQLVILPVIQLVIQVIHLIAMPTTEEPSLALLYITLNGR